MCEITFSFFMPASWARNFVQDKNYETKCKLQYLYQNSQAVKKAVTLSEKNCEINGGSCNDLDANHIYDLLVLSPI